MLGLVDCKGRPLKVGDTVVLFPIRFIRRSTAEETERILREWGGQYKWLCYAVEIKSLSVVANCIILNGGAFSNNPFGATVSPYSIVLIPSSNLSRDQLLLYLALEGFTEDSA